MPFSIPRPKSREDDLRAGRIPSLYLWMELKEGFSNDAENPHPGTWFTSMFRNHYEGFSCLFPERGAFIGPKPFMRE
jgi:hypothetical protein